MKTPSWIAMTSLLLSAAASAVDVHIDRECDAMSAAHAINDCSSEKLKEANEEMNRLYEKKVSMLATGETKEKFRAAQRAWLTFRDKVCLYELGTPEGTGSASPFQINGCIEFYTKRRIEDLKYYLSCTSDDCPH